MRKQALNEETSTSTQQGNKHSRKQAPDPTRAQQGNKHQGQDQHPSSLQFCLLLLACYGTRKPWAHKKEYSKELCSKSDCKVEPKVEPKWQRPTLTKHAQASSDHISTPLLEASVSLHKRALEKYVEKPTWKLTFYSGSPREKRRESHFVLARCRADAIGFAQQ